MKTLKEVIKEYLKNDAPEFSPEVLLYHRSMIEEKLRCMFASVISEALDEIEEKLTAEEE